MATATVSSNFFCLLLLVDSDEIMRGIKFDLGVYFSREEVKLFTHYLDEDNSGDVDLEEFVAKINFKDY